jgi:hypothetical protein
MGFTNESAAYRCLSCIIGSRREAGNGAGVAESRQLQDLVEKRPNGHGLGDPRQFALANEFQIS